MSKSMSYGIEARGIGSVSRRFTELHGGVIKPRRDHHFDNHVEGSQAERPKSPKPEIPLLGIHEHSDTLGFSDPAERFDLDTIDRRATSGSAIIRGIEPGRVYSLFDSENDGEPIELGLPEAGFHIAGPGYLRDLSRNNAEMQRIHLE